MRQTADIEVNTAGITYGGMKSHTGALIATSTRKSIIRMFVPSLWIFASISDFIGYVGESSGAGSGQKTGGPSLEYNADK